MMAVLLGLITGSSVTLPTDQQPHEKPRQNPFRLGQGFCLSPGRSFASLFVARLRLTKQLTNNHYLYWFVGHPERERLAP